MAQNPSSKGIGHGAAQVFDTSAPLNMLFALDQNKKQKAAAQDTQKQKAIDELKGKYLDLKDKRGFYTRDSESIMNMWGNIDEKFAGKWEQVATDPQVQKEYYDALREVNMLLDKSDEQKEYLKIVQTMYDQDAARPENERLFTTDQRAMLDDMFTDPAYLSNPDKFLETYNEIRKPQQNLPNPIDYAIEKIPFASHIKSTGYGYDANGVHVSGSGTGLDQAAYKNALITYVKTDPVMQQAAIKAGYTDDNGALDSEAYANDVMLQFSKKNNEYQSKSLSGTGKIKFNPENATTLNYEFPVTKVKTSKGFSGWGGGDTTEEDNVIFDVGIQLPSTVDAAIPFTSQTRNLSYETGKAPSGRVNPKTSYSQVVYGDYEGKEGLYVIGVTNETYDDTDSKKVVKESSNIIRPFDEVRDVLIDQFGNDYVTEMEGYIKGGGKLPSSSNLPQGDNSLELR